MKRIRLTKQEKGIEDALIRKEYLDVSKLEFEEIAGAVAHRRKDAVLSIRVNSQDLAEIKQRAQKMGIKYQAFLSELIHRVAHIEKRGGRRDLGTHPIS